MTHKNVEMSWSDIQTKGFMVVPSFLSLGECDDLLKEWRSIAGNARAKHDPGGRSPRVSMETKNRFAPRILEVAKHVGDCTTTKGDIIRSGQYYSIDMGVGFGWHIDHDSYYLTQDSVNSLNFWIAIQKPDRKKSGISVVPFDSMIATFPELARWAIGKGAIDCRPGIGITEFVDLDRVETLNIPGSNALEEIAVMPEVDPGDLILMRGDLFHRTQDTETSRISVAFRVAHSQSPISRAKLMHMGSGKFYTMAGKRAHYAKRFAAFEIAGRDTLTVAESEAICESLTVKITALLESLGIHELNNDQFRCLVSECASEYLQNRKLADRIDRQE